MLPLKTGLSCVRSQNAEVTRQMSVARAAQDEVDAVRREMQEKLKAAQEYTERQVSVYPRQISCLIAGKTKNVVSCS